MTRPDLEATDDPKQLAETVRQGVNNFGELTEAGEAALEAILAYVAEVEQRAERAENGAMAERLRARKAERERDEARAGRDEWHETALACQAELEQAREVRATAEAVLKNWRGNNRGWVNPGELAGNLARLRAALEKP